MPKPIVHPAPAADNETRPYWEGAARGELVLQRCTRCGSVQHRPRALCIACLAPGVEHFVASGRGTVYSFTVTHQNQAPGFREAVPYVLAYVDLAEGPRLLTNVVGCAPAEVRVGLPVRVEFAKTDGEFPVPVFCPA
ncbi:MAG TPA: Zn-ribbon domain-containing OB-fold protein [Myxococcota bacterium]|jgi:uncharacterized OB-fold protein|nr:Zn-ribbon domain-containing OB-fold protein [Myxococcota bacterium]